MAVSRAETLAPPVTYEEYLAEGEVMARYDIIDGVYHMTNPPRRHQRLLLNIVQAFHAYEAASGLGQVIVSPCDVLIRRAPLRIRQPDVLFISHERLERNPPATEAAPLTAAPELVVEILSPSEGKTARREKLADYASVGGQECWLVDPNDASVTLLRLGEAGAREVAVCRGEEEASSAAFPGLALPVAAIFAA